MGKTYDLINESFTKKYNLLSEEKLDEKLPNDLAHAYQRTDWSSHGEFPRYLYQTGSYRSKGDMIDYENATYTEITPEQAEEMKKNGEDLSSLRIIMNNLESKDTPILLTFKSDGTPRYYNTRNIGDRNGKFYVKRTGKLETDSRYIPFSWICDNAIKIYKTNEDSVNISREKLKRREDPNYDTKIYAGNDSGIKNDKFHLKQVQQRLKKLEISHDNGTLSDRDYDFHKKYCLQDIEFYSNRLNQNRKEAEEAIRRWNDYEANHEFLQKQKDLQDLKYKLRYTNADLNQVKDKYNDLVTNGRDAEIFRSTRKRISSIKDNINDYLLELRNLEKKLSQKNIDVNIADYEVKTSELQNQVDELNNRINSMLHRNKNKPQGEQ